MIADLKFGFRMLAKMRGSALIAWLTVARGIGANSAIFRVIESILLSFRHRTSWWRMTFDLKQINPRFT